MADLTVREQQIVRLVGLGLSGHCIATTLGIALLTVRKHRSNIATKLGLSNTARLAAHCVQTLCPERTDCADANTFPATTRARQAALPASMRTGDSAGLRMKNADLHPREIEVVRLVAQGLTSKEIAKALEISPRTVSKHRQNIMRKLHIHHVVELMHIDQHFY